MDTVHISEHRVRRNAHNVYFGKPKVEINIWDFVSGAVGMGIFIAGITAVWVLFAALVGAS